MVFSKRFFSSFLICISYKQYKILLSEARFKYKHYHSFLATQYTVLGRHRQVSGAPGKARIQLKYSQCTEKTQNALDRYPDSLSSTAPARTVLILGIYSNAVPFQEQMQCLTQQPLYLSVQVCLSVCVGLWGTPESRRCQVPCNESYRCLWAA